MARRHGWTRISVAALLAAGCAMAPAPVPPEGARPHLDQDWWPHRAAQLGISVDEARARDAAIPVDVPPESAVSPEMRVEAALLWSAACASCHGATGRLENVPEQSPAPRAWGSMGARMGFLFGGDAMRAGIYRKITDGGPPGADGRASTMPRWGTRLSREQIWALVAHIESL